MLWLRTFWFSELEKFISVVDKLFNLRYFVTDVQTKTVCSVRKTSENDGKAMQIMHGAS